MSYGKELVLGKTKDAAHSLNGGDGVAGGKYQLYVSMCCVPNIPEISRWERHLSHQWIRNWAV